MKTSLAGSLGRMNQRERTLVLSLVGVLVVLLIGGSAWYVSNTLSSKKDKVRRNAKTWTKIQNKAKTFLESQQKHEAVVARIKNNPDARSPDSPFAQAAVRTKVHYRTGSSSEDETAMLNKILHPTGELRQKPLVGKRRKSVGPQFYRVEKQFNMKRGYVKIDDIWSFLSSVEAMDNLVFVSKLHVVRWSRDPDYGQIRDLTASTLRYVETEGEE